MEPTYLCEIVAVAALLAHLEGVAVDEKGRAGDQIAEGAFNRGSLTFCLKIDLNNSAPSP
jgi:hypothetical protein